MARKEAMIKITRIDKKDKISDIDQQLIDSGDNYLSISITLVSFVLRCVTTLYHVVSLCMTLMTLLPFYKRSKNEIRRYMDLNFSENIALNE